jgi:membrane fusion protein (multidrug efflux system)/multidrug efflux system membrane fusion protein
MVEVIGDVAASDAAGLRPGTFAEITVPVGQNGAALVVPQTAIRPSEKGFLAYVVEGAVARERVLTLGMRTADGLVEVRSGLSAGERLVVRGGEALRDGATVRLPGAGPAAQNGPPAPPGRSTGKP